jgi:hypothetical protein
MMVGAAGLLDTLFAADVRTVRSRMRKSFLACGVRANVGLLPAMDPVVLF